MEKIRIQKLIADSGLCSRRKAEEYISQGKVKINGRPCKLGDKALPTDLITVDGKKIYIAKKREFYYIMLNKPRGYVTTAKDELGRKSVMDLISDIDVRLFPVGRLDRNSEGLLLFTNDGEFANDLTHPSRHVTKTYRVTVTSRVNDEQLVELSTGIELDGKKTSPATINVLTNDPNRAVLQFIIHEGRNRQVRRMCEAVGLEVARLKRTSVGPLKLGMLKPGTWRELTPAELQAIRNAIIKKK